MLSIKTNAQVFKQAINCKASENNKMMLERSSKSKIEYLDFEEFTKNFIKEKNTDENKVKYIIPVVFHVFGTSFSGLSVTQAKIEEALLKLNEDFQGLNSDYNTVDSKFDPIKQTLDIEFRLAKLNPEGNPTTGVEFYEVLNGFGNGSGYDEQIKKYAWKNYMYMNVYIQLDLYNDGKLNSSGVAWYPDSWMSDNDLARVVYNGKYIYANTNPEFASVLTHEFGHWLNLIHTFEGGCTTPNDNVSDTPAEDASVANDCAPATNCLSENINYENYMGYNGAAGCYKMYTQGQVDRMLAALMHPTRKPLWQKENLIKTGTDDDVVSADYSLSKKSKFVVYPNPATDNITLEITNDNSKVLTVKIYNLNGALVEVLKDKRKFSIKGLKPGIYTIQLITNNFSEASRLVIK